MIADDIVQQMERCATLNKQLSLAHSRWIEAHTERHRALEEARQARNELDAMLDKRIRMLAGEPEPEKPASMFDAGIITHTSEVRTNREC